jgi:Ankyrin repeats (3 copies)
MNHIPSGDDDDDMERRFRRGLAGDSSRPSDAVRRAILEHASRIAADHVDRPQKRTPGIFVARRRRAVFGTLAAAVFAGLLVVPLFRTPVIRETGPTASLQEPVSAPAAAPEAAPTPAPAAVPAPAPAQASAPTRSSNAQAPRRAAPDAKPEAVDSTSYSSDGAKQANTNVPAPIDTVAGRPEVAASPAPPIGSADSAVPGMAGASLARAVTFATQRGESLRRAAVSGDLVAVNALLSSAFDIDSRDPRGRTALMLAIVNGHAEVVDTLLAHGADVNALDASGARPMQLARAQGNQQIIDSLSRAGAH